MIGDGCTIPLEFYGQKSVILAKSGGGKSYTARVVIEEGRALGVTFVVIDPQDAYKNMPDFEYIDAEKVTNVKAFGQLIALSGRCVVISVKRLTPEQANAWVRAFLREYRRFAKKGIKTVIIDELHKFAPEMQNTLAKDTIRGMAQEDRSDGTGFIGISQRSSRVDKTIIAQANTIFIGRLDAPVDIDSVKGYIPEKNADVVKRLPIGSFYIIGDLADQTGGARVVKIRKATTEHSGGSPKVLLTENRAMYDQHARLVVKNGGRSNIQSTGETMESKDLVNGIVPSVDTFGSLAMKGAKMSLGMAAAGIVGGFASRIKSPIPYVSSRSIGAAVTTVVLYAGWKHIDNPTVKDVLGYAAAGSAVFTVGSLIADIVAATRFQLPSIVQVGLTAATGVPPMQVEGNGMFAPNVSA